MPDEGIQTSIAIIGTESMADQSRTPLGRRKMEGAANAMFSSDAAMRAEGVSISPKRTARTMDSGNKCHQRLGSW